MARKKTLSEKLHEQWMEERGLKKTKMGEETRKTSSDYFLKGLEELIREWEEWKEQ